MNDKTTPRPASRFQGRRVWVTGGGSGMGRAVVHRLCAEGAHVLAMDLDEAALAVTLRQAEALADHGGQVCSAHGSVTSEEDVRRALGAFGSEGLDALVHMAGILRTARVEQTSLEQFGEVLDVNLVGSFLCCREALPLLERRQGNIVLAASTAACFGAPYVAAYAASKGGVLGLMHALAREYLLRGVRVNAVVPGAVRTPMVENMASVEGADMSLYWNMARPDRRIGLPEQVAGVVAMLASDDGALLQGETIRLDGGVYG